MPKTTSPPALLNEPLQKATPLTRGSGASRKPALVPVEPRKTFAVAFHQRRGQLNSGLPFALYSKERFVIRIEPRCASGTFTLSSSSTSPRSLSASNRVAPVGGEPPKSEKTAGKARLTFVSLR